MIALALFGGLLLSAALASIAYVTAARKTAIPTKELNEAIRCLDQILGYDEHACCLAPDLRLRAKEITNKYYKELNS